MRRVSGASLADRNYVKVPLIYALVSSAYIMGSTFVSGAALGYTDEIFLVEALKGTVFVLVTAAVLWFVLYREYRSTLLGQSSFRMLVENLPDAVFLLALPERRIVYANPAACALFGYSEQELVGNTTEMLYPNRASYDEFHARGVETLLKGERFSAGFEMRRRSGELFPTSHVVSMYKDGGGGEFALSIVRDESEKHAYEHRLRESEERLRMIADNLREVLWVSDADKGALYYVSPAYERVWGRSIDEIYKDPRSFLDSIHPEDRAQVEARVPDQRDGTYDVQYRIVRDDGEVRWIWDRAVPIRAGDGRVHRIVGIAEDITDLRQREAELRQSQKMEAVGHLSGGVAHDFNNLLTIILGNAEAIDETLDAGSPYRHELGAIIGASRSAAALTQRLLAFSRQHVPQIESVDISALIQDIAERLLKRTLGATIRIETHLADEAWRVGADRSQLETSLVNLAINARDAMPSGGRLTLTTRNVTLNASDVERRGADIEPGDYVELRVADTGVGMSPDVAARAFDPFFTTKPPGRGTGLGLSAVYGFVQQSAGHIRVHTSEHRGTGFEILLPRFSGSAEAGSDMAAPTQGGAETLLVVEDDTSVRDVVTSQLRRLGYDVHEAGDGPAALALLERIGRLDLLVTDVIMPGGVTGPELATAVVAARPELKVLFMSGYSERSALEGAGWSAGTAILKKPYTRTELAQAVRAALDA